MTTLDEFVAEQMKIPAFRKEYEAQEAEFALAQAMMDARRNAGMTPEMLSERSGVAKDEINRLESGDSDPSVSTLQRLAAAIGMKLKIEFQPIG